MKKILFALALATAFVACKKESDSKPDIEVVTPTDNQVYSLGQTVTIDLSITDMDDIVWVHVHGTDLTDTTEMYHHEDSLDANFYTFSDIVVPSRAGQYKIDFHASDRKGNEQYIWRYFTVE